jgi:hypothetical protein
VLNKAVVFDALVAAGITSLTIEFDGEGDSGQLTWLSPLYAAIMRVKPRWPIEAVAMRLTTQVIRDSVAQPGSPDATN